MEQTDKPETKLTNTSRRHLLTSVSSVLTVSLGRLLGGISHQDISLSTDSTSQGMMQRRSQSTTGSLASERPAYIVLPGGTAWTVLANLPYLQKVSGGQTPVILMDTHDYTRLQGVALKQEDDPFMQSVALAYDYLYRCGVVQFIDYADFYSRSTQQTMLRQNRALLDELSAASQQRAAVRAADGWIDYGRGTFQTAFRGRLGGEQENYDRARQRKLAHRQKLARDDETAREWNTKILNQYSAALSIRQYADDIMDFDVQHIIGEGETEMIEEVLESVGSRSDTDTSHIARLEPANHIMALSSEKLAPTRAAIDSVGEIAAEIAGVQHDDWVVFGPELAVSQYHSVVDMETVQDHVRSGVDIDSVAEEAAHVVTTLRQRTGDDPSPAKIDYAVEWIKETETMPHASGRSQSWGLTEITDYAVTLSQHSRELRTLVEQGAVSHTAALVGASIVSDPTSRTDLDTVRRRGEDIISRLDPHAINDEQLTAFHRWDASWEETADWYETAERAR